MRAGTKEELSAMSATDISDRLGSLHEANNEEVEKMRKHLGDLERTRHLIVWHDLSTVANHSHLVFDMDDDYEQLT